MLTKRPRGTTDVLPEAVLDWQRLEQVVRTTCQAYHYSELRTPIFEHTEVFERGVGETTDIVEKEMYTFSDRAGRSITLRPEGTAGAVRAFVENKLYGQPGTTKLYYIGPMFRYENPQKGRQRQFHQFGCEALGSEGPAIDVEVITLNLDILRRFGLSDLTIELNSVGCKDCRPVHKEQLLTVLRPLRERLCKDCQQRLERNPLRIFDCKNGCRDVLQEAGAPTIVDCLCETCQEHFSAVKEGLRKLDIPFAVNEQLVRGLDYYTRSAWEVMAPDGSTVGGGGRYNGLVSDLGGPETAGIGFAVGMERAIALYEEQHKDLVPGDGVDVFIAVADQEAEPVATEFLWRLRQLSLVADRDYQGRSVKAQFKAADRLRAKVVAVFGSAEVANNTVTLKLLATGVQQQMPLTEAIPFILEKVGKDESKS